MGGGLRVPYVVILGPDLKQDTPTIHCLRLRLVGFGSHVRFGFKVSGSRRRT